jgi:hypothetical protein
VANCWGEGRALSLPSSKSEFRRQLNQPRRIGTNYSPKSGAANHSIDRSRAEELSVIEGIERLQPELQ